ncbi:DUF3239 domain-containing protein [Corynebacterium kroppenstedtii]|uniref:DUF3239 domain-containing protein n=1 Tax=Corynebacterium sp. PCR 32 TaxID=3351342 RepID=UPI0030AA35C9
MGTFHFTVDEAFNRQHNEFVRDSRRLQFGAGVLGAFLVVAAVLIFFFVGDDGAWVLFAIVLGLFGLFSLVMVQVIPKKVGSGQSLYDRYELVPAMVARVNPHDVEIMALVNVSVSPDDEPRWALSARTVARVPGSVREVGERIPSVAVTATRSVQHKERWDEVSPMPIGWATKDQNVVRDAEGTIEPAQWKTLAENLDRIDSVMAAKRNLLPL